jgi:hypothetical protein
MRATATFRDGILRGIEPLEEQSASRRCRLPAEAAQPHRVNGDDRIDIYAALMQADAPLAPPQLESRSGRSSANGRFFDENLAANGASDGAATRVGVGFLRDLARLRSAGAGWTNGRPLR